MKIVVTSDDNQHSVAVSTDDIDFEGHSMNQVILCARIRTAIFTLYRKEVEQSKSDQEKGEADLKRIRESGHGIKTDPPAFPL
jgi:hypothetical protein